MQASTAIRHARKYSALSFFGGQYIIIYRHVEQGDTGPTRASQPMDYWRARAMLARHRASDALEILGRNGSRHIPDSLAACLAVDHASNTASATSELVDRALAWLAAGNYCP